MTIYTNGELLTKIRLSVIKTSGRWKKLKEKMVAEGSESS